MTNGLEIDLYNPADREDCIGLLASCFPGTSNENTFRWRFESPGRMAPIIICARHKGKVISFSSWIPWEFAYKNLIYIACQAGESATHTDYRGRGILQKVVRYADNVAFEKGIDFVFAFPNRLSYVPYLKSGYYSVAANFYSVRPLNPLLSRTACNSHGINGIPDSEMLVQESKITPVINRDYCKWRFDENTKNYERMEYLHGNSAIVFYLQRNIRKGVPELILLDSQFTTFNEWHVRKAIRHIDSAFTRRALYIRTFFNENSDRGKALKKYFPINVKSKYQVLIVKNISKRLDSGIIFNSNNWDIMPHCVDWL